ncbi:MAG: M14 family metallopeptidase [Polyangiales bacterium]
MANDALGKLSALSRGFRSNYLRNADVEAQMRAWAEAFPELVRLRSIGSSHDGAPLWLLTIGPDPDRVRPAAWIDGNMHATELAGSSVALAIAEDVIRLHLAPDAELHALPAHVRARLRDVVFHVLPRMCPDGAECVLVDGRYVRSNPRDRRTNKQHARWIGKDVDGDGLSLSMRKVDPGGEFVDCPEVPGLLLPRRLEDPGPYYKVYPEGLIENFDGVHVPDPYFLSDNEVDLNRNFPWSWMPDHEQAGAGAFATSEPESRAVVEYVTAHPEIFALLNLHTFGGVFIRPLGHKSDKQMDQSDLALFRQIEQWGEQIVGYPTVSGYEEFTYEPDKPLHGDLTDFGYHARGAIAYVCEIWDLFKQIGIARRKPFADHYTHVTREEMVRLGVWDRDHNHSRVMRPWKKLQHPQLGEVEVGGVDGRVGMSNPPYEMLPEICDKQAAMFLRVAAMAPALVVEDARVIDLGDGVRRVDVTVANHGYLPTYVLASAKKLAHNEPVSVEATARGCTLVDPSHARRELGHLEGWGRGLHDGSSALFYMRSRGTGHGRTVGYAVRGKGTLTLRIGGCRTGWLTETIEVG